MSRSIVRFLGGLALLNGYAAVAVTQPCELGWLPGGTHWAFESVLAAVHWDQDGAGGDPPALVVAGRFRYAGTTPAQNVAILRGEEWSPLGAGLGDSSSTLVYALAVHDGALIAAGRFGNSGQTEYSHVVRWNGAAWDNLNLPVAAPAQAQVAVRALASYQGELFAAGTFELTGCAECRHIARWDGASWRAVGGGLDGGARALLPYRGRLIAGGSFERAGGQVSARLAAWDGAEWSRVSADQPTDVRPIQALAEMHDKLYIGRYTTYTYDSSVACYDGAAWTELGNQTGIEGMTSHNNELYVIGRNPPLSVISRWDGAQWHELGHTQLESMYGKAGYFAYVPLVFSHAGRLLAGGQATLIGGLRTGGLAAWNGSTWGPVRSDVPNVSPSVLVPWRGEMYAGGSFTAVAGENARFVARHNLVHWTPVLDGPVSISYSSPDTWSGVHAAVVFQEELIVGGSSQGTTPIFARWNGRRWDSIFHAPTWLGVSALTVAGDELIVAAPMRRTLSGDDFVELHAWDGSSLRLLGRAQRHPPSPGSYPLSPYVNALTTYRDQLIAAGYFDTLDGVACLNIAAWNGVQWMPLKDGLDDRTFALAVFEDDLIAGGSFQRSGATSLARVARWDGRAWQRLGAGFDANVHALTTFRGHLLAGGAFTRGGPDHPTLALPGLARWNGAEWEPFEGGVTGSVRALGTLGDTLYISGTTSAGGEEAHVIARWGAAGTRGDADGDGALTLEDIDCFVAALRGAEAWSECAGLQRGSAAVYLCRNDASVDGRVDFDDIEPFVACLIAGACE